MSEIHELAALREAIDVAYAAIAATGNSATTDYRLIDSHDTAKGKFTLACWHRIGEAATEYDQQAARLSAVEAENARLKAALESIRRETVLHDEMAAHRAHELAREALVEPGT